MILKSIMNKAAELKHRLLPETIPGESLSLSAGSGVIAYARYQAVKLDKDADHWQIEALLHRQSRGTACLVDRVVVPMLHTTESRAAATAWLDTHKMTKDAAVMHFKDSYKRDIAEVYPVLAR